jgi:Protein of unknown function (DUF2975)
MSDQTRLVRLSGQLYWMATVLAYALPLLVIGSILRGVLYPDALLRQFPALAKGTEISAVQGALSAMIAVVAVLPMIAAFMGMSRLFNRYRQGEILTDDNAEDILRIGRAMLFVAMATVLVPTLQLLVLSWNATPRTLQIGIDGGTLGFVLSAGLLTVIGWAMRDAARVKAENEGFV